MTSRLSLEKGLLSERAHLALPFGFSIGFASMLAASGNLFRSPLSAFLLLLTPVVGAASLRWREWRGWLTLAMVAMSYEALARVVDRVADPSTLLSFFSLDEHLWGFNLTGWVQSSLSSATMTGMMALSYQLLMPVLFATSAYVWIRGGANFGKYVTALLLTSYAALFTFLLLPTAPPWLSGSASNLLRTSGLGTLPGFLAPFAALVKPNEFASFPSLHAAYSVTCSYFLLKVNRRAGAAAVSLTGLIFISTLYLGQHYLVDLLAGTGYAIVPCIVSERFQFFRNLGEAAGKLFS